MCDKISASYLLFFCLFFSKYFSKKPVENVDRLKNERISLVEKIKIINKAEKWVSNVLILSEFILKSPSVISTIVSRKKKYIKAFDDPRLDPLRKTKKTTPFKAIRKVLKISSPIKTRISINEHPKSKSCRDSISN